MNDNIFVSINDAIQRIQNIVNQNSDEKEAIYERLYNLSSILQYPTRAYTDGALLNTTSIKKSTNSSIDDDDISLNPANSISSSEKAKSSSLNLELSRRNANELERKRVNNRLSGFSLKDSVAWQEICKRYGPNLNQTELLSMAEIIAQEAGIKVDREAKRRKEVLIKWYEENLQIILKMLPFFKLVDSDGNALRGDDDQDDTNKNDSDENNEENNNENEEYNSMNNEDIDTENNRGINYDNTIFDENNNNEHNSEDYNNNEDSGINHEVDSVD